MTIALRRYKVYQTFYLTLLLLCLSFVKGSAQGSNEVAKYYRQVHQAYIHLCRGNVIAAGTMFDSAFSYRTPFFTDLNNAIYTEINSPAPDRRKVNRYLTQMQQKGLCVHEQYKDIANYQAYLSMVDCRQCNHVGDTSLRRKIQEAIAFDQVLRHFSFDSLGKYYDTRILPALDKVDSVNLCLADSVLRIVLAGDIPAEELIGYDGFNRLWTILLHNGPWGRYEKGLLDSLVWMGMTDNREISFLFDSHCSGNYARIIYSNWTREQRCDADCQLFGTRLFNHLNDKIYITGIDSIKRAGINKLREIYYLPDVIEEAKIRAFIAFTIDYGLAYPGMVHMSYEGAETTFEKNYKGYPYIRYLDKQDYDFDRNFAIGK